jgi:transcriptional regulator with XRE-family HTH domain
MTTGGRQAIPKCAPVARTLGQILKAARLRARLSQSAVARSAEIDASILSNIESGKRTDLRFDTVARIAEVLGISLDTIAHDCGYRFAIHPNESVTGDIMRAIEVLRKAQAQEQSAYAGTEEALRILDSLRASRRRE